MICLGRTPVDITNVRFGRLVAVKYVNGKWLCRCDCGNEIYATYSALDREHGTKSCGCLKQELARQVGHKVEHKYVNLVGQTFGDLTVLARKDNTNWKCKCKCGKIIYRSTKTLYHGKHLHCEHNKLRYYDISGQCFGNLQVISFSEIKLGHTYWKCRCKCGNITKVEGSHLKSGHTISCGCIDISHRGSKVENEIRDYIDRLISGD